MNEVGEREPGIEFTSRGRTITEADLTNFSALTGDWHPQHSDAEWAAQSHFAGRVAHGMLVLSYAVGLVSFDPELVVALRGVESVTFKRPVRIGDTIRVASRVDGVRPLDEETALVRLALRVLNQSDESVARITLSVVSRRGGGAAAGNGATVAEPEFEEVFL